MNRLEDICNDYINGDRTNSIDTIIDYGIDILEYVDSVLWSWLVNYREYGIGNGEDLIKEISKTIYNLE